MLHKLNYVINSNDYDILQQFKEKLSLVGIETKPLKSSDKYCCFESSWNDSDAQNLHLKNSNSRNAGAKPKQLQYNGKPVTCGMVYQFRHTKNLSDAEIASLFDISESTVCRRRKKHISNGDFYSNSSTIF